MKQKRVFLITGAGRGLGRETAMQLARRGDIVYAGVRDLARARRDYAAVNAQGLVLLRLDVTRPKDIAAAVARIHKDHGRLDVLVNNAGYGYYGAFEELDDRGFRKQMEVNFFGALALTRACLPTMRAAGGGRVVNVSSILGKLTIPTGSAYTASKWAMEAWSEALRYEVFRFGIEVVLIEPGLVRTHFKDSTVYSNRSSDTASPYAFLNKLLRREYSGFSTSPEVAAAWILRIVDRRRLPVRARVGWDAVFYNLLRRVLPDAVWDGLIRWRVQGL